MSQTDQEQIEMLQKFWRDYGNSIIIGVLVIVVALGGYNFYQSQAQKSREAASDVYQGLVVAVSEENDTTLETVKKVSDELRADHKGSVYAIHAALYVAKFEMDAGSHENAIAQYDWVISNAKNQEYKDVALLRKARLVAQFDSVENGLALIDGQTSQSQEASFLETSGDFYQQLGRTDDAVAAYEAALVVVEEAQFNRPFLQLKLDNLKVAN